MASRKSLGDAPDLIQSRLVRLETQLRELLTSPAFRFDKSISSRLPKRAGIYRIFDPTNPSETVRAGKTMAASGLRGRVYGNHLMGSQKGNLRSQLKGRMPGCDDLKAAKEYIREHLTVQVLVIPDKRERDRLEHFMLAVLEPTYCD